MHLPQLLRGLGASRTRPPAPTDMVQAASLCSQRQRVLLAHKEFLPWRPPNFVTSSFAVQSIAIPAPFKVGECAVDALDEIIGMLVEVY